MFFDHQTNLRYLVFFQDTEVRNVDKLKALRVLRRFTHTYGQALQWFEEKQDSSATSNNSSERLVCRRRGAAPQSLDDVIICLPGTFDLTPDKLLQQFHFLKSTLNARNAKFISDAFLNISRKIPEQIFLTHYLEFVRQEQFPKLGKFEESKDISLKFVFFRCYREQRNSSFTN